MSDLGFTCFYWRDEPIPDIRAWARERGEQMVLVRKTWREANVYAGTITSRSSIEEMPVSFFSGMRFGGPDDTWYAELDRFDP